MVVAPCTHLTLAVLSPNPILFTYRKYFPTLRRYDAIPLLIYWSFCFAISFLFFRLFDSFVIVVDSAVGGTD